MMQVDGYTETEFKDTEIGPIPVEWKVVELSQVSNLIMGQSPPSDTYNVEGRGLPFLQGKAEFGLRYPVPEKFCSVPQRTAPPGSILISVRAPVGDVNITPEAVCIGRGLGAITATDKSDIHYLFYLLMYSKNRLEDEGTGSTFKSINKNVLKNFPIPLPPLPEQRRIAAVLNAIQDEIAAQDDIIAAAREFKRSLMQRLFTYGPGSEPAETKETEIGEIPSHWSLEPLDALCFEHKQLVNPNEIASMPYVGLEHISPNIPRLRAYGSSEDVTSSKTLFKRNYVLYGKLRPYLDKAAVTLFDGVCSTDIIVLEARDGKSTPDFLVNLLHTPEFLAYSTSTMTGVNHPRTNWSSLKKYLVATPPLTEQRQIGAHLSGTEDKIAAEEDRKTALQDFFKTILHQLMSGQIRL